MTDDSDQEKKKGGISAEDRHLWARVMESVRPLPGRRLLPEANEAEAKPVIPVHTSKETSSLFERLLPASSSPPSEIMSRDMDRKTAEKLWRGKMPIDSVLDLHGLRQQEAQDQLTRTVTGAYASGKRCLLVITGKGSRSAGDEPGVLRRMLPVWMGLEPMKSIVLAVEQARQKDGGSGAFYVYLRRKR